MKYYEHRETGELLSKKEALKIWCDEYDGNDPTNDLPFDEIFRKTDITVEEV